MQHEPGKSAPVDAGSRDAPEQPSPMVVSLDSEGFIRLRWAAGLVVTGELARAAVAAVDRISAGQRHPMLVEMASTAAVTREARTVFARNASNSAIALLGRSAVDRVIANFVLGVSPATVPTRFFTAEPSAVSWLREAGDA